MRLLAPTNTLLKFMQMTLSEAMRVSLKLPVGGPDGKGVEAVLTRQHFEKLATPLFERMRLAVDEACWQVCPLFLIPKLTGYWIRVPYRDSDGGGYQAHVALCPL